MLKKYYPGLSLFGEITKDFRAAAGERKNSKSIPVL